MTAANLPQPARTYGPGRFSPTVIAAPHELEAVSEVMRVTLETNPLITELEEELTAHGGVKAQITVSTLVFGMLLAILCKGKALDIYTHAALVDLPDRLKRELNVIDADGHELTYTQVNHKRGRLLELLRARSERIDRTTTTTPVADLVNEMLQVTLTAENRAATTLGLDGTVIPSTEHPDSVRVDPETGEKLSDGSLGHAPKKRHGSGFIHGYEVQVVATVEAGLPKLIHAVDVHANDTGRRIQAVPVVINLAERGQLTRVVHDAGYDFKNTDVFAGPFHAAGVGRVFDPRHYRRRGDQDIDGAKILDGAPFCPCIAQGLLEIEKPIGADRFVTAAKYDNRRPFALARHGSTNAGTSRYKCPALAGKVRCPKQPASLKLPATKPTVDNRPLDGFPDPKICSQGTISISDEVLLRDMQAVLYGTTRWLNIYRRRNLIETANSTIRERFSLEVGAIRSPSIEMYGLVLGLAAVATNIKTLWNHRGIAEHARARAA